MTSVNLAAIRAGIAQILEGIPSIQRVNQYAYRGEAYNNLPFATILRGQVEGPGISLTGKPPDTQLGGFDHLITWQIRVYAALGNISDAQAFDDTLTAALLTAFNGNLLIQPNGAGVVDQSRLSTITPFLQDENRPAVWISEATLQTFVIATS